MKIGNREVVVGDKIIRSTWNEEEEVQVMFFGKHGFLGAERSGYENYYDYAQDAGTWSFYEPTPKLPEEMPSLGHDDLGCYCEDLSGKVNDIIKYLKAKE